MPNPGKGVATKVATSAAIEAIDGGRSGDWFDPQDIEGSALKLHALLSDPVRLQRMREHAPRFAAGHDVRRSIEKLEGIYRRAMQGRFA